MTFPASPSLSEKSYFSLEKDKTVPIGRNCDMARASALEWACSAIQWRGGLRPRKKGSKICYLFASASHAERRKDERVQRSPTQQVVRVEGSRRLRRIRHHKRSGARGRQGLAKPNATCGWKMFAVCANCGTRVRRAVRPSPSISRRFAMRRGSGSRKSADERRWHLVAVVRVC